MSKTKRILSFLLTAVMILSITSVGVNAEWSSYRGQYINYDSVDKPVLTTDQYASMVLDEVDRMLAKENLVVYEDLAGLITLDLSFTSIDTALDSIEETIGMAGAVLPMAGDLGSLNVTAIAADGAPRRLGTNSDKDVIISLVKFLKDNAALIKKAVISSSSPDALNLGVLSTFVSLPDIPNMIKGMVYELGHDDDAPETVTATMDELLQDVINKYLVGEIDPETGEYTGFLPELAGLVDIDSMSMYDMVEQAFRSVYNGKITDLLDTRVRTWLVKKVADNPLMADLVNVDYVVPAINFNTWSSTDTFVDHINEILGLFVTALAKPALGITWNYSNGNADLLNNIIAAGKIIVAETGSAFFADYVEVIDPSTFPSTPEGNEQFVAYLVRSIINGSIDYVEVPATMDTLIEVANYTVIELAGDYIPSQYDYYKDMDLTSIDTLLDVGADFAVYFISQEMDMSLYFGDGFDLTIEAIVDWAVANYGGLIASSTGTGWERINNIIFQIIDTSWLPAGTFTTDDAGNPDLRTFLVDDILGNIFSLNIDAFLGLLERNTAGDFNGTVTTFLAKTFAKVINFILGSGTAAVYPSFEAMIDGSSATANLPVLIQNLLTNLYTRANGTLLNSLLPLACMILGLSDEQEFEYPYISLEDSMTAAATTFYIFNESSGLNTAATNSTWERVQDSLYQYRIKSITTNDANISVKYNGSAVNNLMIDGGVRRDFNITGTFTNNSLLILTITYDIFGEAGTAITTNPIVQKVYTYVSNAKDDSDLLVNVDVLLDDANRHKASYYKTTYITQGSEENPRVDRLNDVEFTLKRRPADDEESHISNATITAGNSVLNATLASCGVSLAPFTTITTTGSGGNWEVNPYLVSDTATRPADGVYTSNFYYVCGPSRGAAANNPETLQLSHNVVFYNDAGLPSAVDSAVSANRQQRAYDTTSTVYDYSYITGYDTENLDENGNPTPIIETGTTTGAQAWVEYTEALEASIALVYAPKQAASFYSPTYLESYAYCKDDLGRAIAKLEACTGTNGTGALKTAVESIVPTNIDYTAPLVTEDDPLTEEDETEYAKYDYYDTVNYQYFSMCDYRPYTYLRFKDELNEAKDLINDSEEGKNVDAVKLLYVTHRFNLYAGRLVRTVAYNNALLSAITAYGGITERGNYSSESWEAYQNAKTFANYVATIPLDDEFANGGNIPAEGEDGYNSGLRQSMVNTARGELIYAYKTLVVSADYTALNNAIAAATITEASENLYTVASWTAYITAKATALAIEPDLVATIDNQEMIDNAASALAAATAGLKLKAIYDALDAQIAAAAEYTDASLYTTESWNTFTTALSAANAVERDLEGTTANQTMINSKASALASAIENLEFLAVPDIVPVEGGTSSGTTLSVVKSDLLMDYPYFNYDTAQSYIFGFDYFDVWLYESMYTTTANASISVGENQMGAFSTGTPIELYDAGGSLLDTYYVVVFGDIDGSAGIDDDDRTLLVDIVAGRAEYFVNFYVPSHDPYYFACDVNSDMSVDDMDITSFDDCNFEFTNQNYIQE